MRIGINTGEVIAVTNARPGEALATGDAVNAAARLEQAARPGQVLVSERTAQAARGFRFAPPQLLELRGKAEPLRALELVAEQPITEGALSGRVPLVGRRRELELLTTTYRRVVEEGRPHLVTLYGEAGVGKSRLVGELLAGLEAASPVPTAVRGRCLAYGDGITYWPFAELLKAYAHALDSDAGDVALARVTDTAEAVLAAAGVDRPRETARTLAVSIGLAPADQAPRNPQEQRAETHFAWRSFFSALAAAAPTVVIVEDVHWADSAVLELLEDVGERAAGPLLVLCTARPELTTRRPTWGGAAEASPDWSSSRSGRRTAGSSSSCCSGRAVGTGDRAAILARAEGNPFFLEEIVRARVRRGRRHPGHRPGGARRAHRSAARRREAGAAGGRGRRPRVLAGRGGRGLLPRGRRRGRGARPAAGPRPHPRPPLVVDERPARADLQARAGPRRRVREPAAARPRRHARRHGRLDRADVRRAPRRGRRADRAPSGGRVSAWGRPTSFEPPRSRPSSRPPRAPMRARASSGRSRSPARRSSWPTPRSSAPVRWKRSATPRSSPSTARPPGRRCARRPTSSPARHPRIACGSPASAASQS